MPGERHLVTIGHSYVVAENRRLAHEMALAGRGRLSRLVPWGIKKGVDVELRDGGLVVELRVVVEHGLQLAEVADRVRSRVQYELDRMVGLPIASLEVHIDGVRSR